MSLTITKTQPTKAKPKVAAKAKVAKQPTETEQLVDTIVEQNPAILAAKEPKKLQDKARKELLELVEPTAEVTEEIVVQGTKGTVKFAACSESLQCIDVKKVHQLLGDDAFYALAKIGITDLRKYLTMHQLADVTEPCYGSRNMSVLPKQD